MLPKNKRANKKLFGDIFSQGFSFHSPHFSLKLLKKEALTKSRFSVSVPQRIEKKATKRNLLRRKIYSLLEYLYPRIKNNYGGVVTLKKDFGKVTFTNLQLEIETLFKNAKILED